MKIHCLFFILPVLFSSPTPGLSGRVLFPLSCIGSSGFCFPFRCPHNREEIGRCFFPIQKCCRRQK
ncbi:beta-defensin 2 precursor [Canis lupus familiaris]|uniref:Defensin, beta 4A n=4 Tax=Canis lupus TaxID=9612 RepID=A0A8C0MUP8_CANLF|nr:beta-defensin 2 precursor [Canis lupus familiaris]AAY59709.1 beta-defensin 102 [Canis lupus familiaris]|eukprot:NP_001107187.1 beta-defensin 2 precursor [Canis lupus familiaris]